MRKIRFIALIILSFLALGLIKPLEELVLEEIESVPFFIEEFIKSIFNIFSEDGDGIGFMN